jgi:hypothetical protein
MSAPLLIPTGLAHVEQFVGIDDVLAAWVLQCNIVAAGSCRAGEMPNDPTYPFVMFTRVGGGDDRVTDYPSVDADIFHPDITVASTVGDRVHRAIKALKPRGLAQRPTVLAPVDLDDGTTASVPFVVDRLEVVDYPTLRDYEDDSVKRFVGRYRIEHRCTAAQ